MDIEALREQLADIDRQLLELVGQRQEVVRSISEVKDGQGAALRSFSQEKVVLDRARNLATELGLSADLAESLMRHLIEESLTLQEQRRVEGQAGGAGRRALIIGGEGRMGKWFARFLASQDFSVEIADPSPPSGEFPHLTRWQDSPLDHELIVVATTLRTSREILEELSVRQPAGVVFDIGSLKTPLAEALERLAAAGVEVTSLHPMFGPDAELLSGRHVIVVDVGCPQANATVRGLFEATMAEMVEMRLTDHDRTIAYVLGLSHALNIAFVTALAESGEAAPYLARLSSTTFDRQLEVAEVVVAENPHLYFEIQALNEYGGDSLQALREASTRLEKLVGDGDEEAFVDLMKQGLQYLVGRGLSVESS